MASLDHEGDTIEDLSVKRSEGGSAEEYKGQGQLLDLSDDVLLCILKNCTPQDLKALGHTCRRLGLLICDYTLWQRVDARELPTGHERMKWFLTYCLSAATVELKLTGCVDKFTRCLAGNKANGETESPIDIDESVTHVTPTSSGTSPICQENGYNSTKAQPKTLESQDGDQRSEKSSNEATIDKDQAVDLSTNQNTQPPTSSSNTSNPCSSESNPGTSISNPGSSTSDPVSTNSNPGSYTSNPCTSNSNPGSSTSNPGSSESQASKIRRSNSNLIALLMNNSSSMSSIEDEVECMVLHRHGPQFTFNQKLLRTLSSKCHNLTTLVLEYCNLDYKQSSLADFPHKLKKLSLKGSWCYNVPEHSSYLHWIQHRLPELEYLDVSECDWFDATSLISISKVPNLRELYMKHCRRLTECVEYASLAARQGFKRLRVVDMRGSPVGDPEVSAFGWLPVLEELYCAPPLKCSVVCSGETHHTTEALHPWEREEPEYYKCKSPSPDLMEEDEEKAEKEESKQVTTECRYGDSEIETYMNWALSERRAAHLLNRQNHNEFRLYYDILPRPDLEDLPQPGPSKRPRSEEQLEVVKRLRLRLQNYDKDQSEAGDQNVDRPNEAGSSSDVPMVATDDAGPSNVERPNIDRPNNDRPNTDRPITDGEAGPSPSFVNLDRPNINRPIANDSLDEEIRPTERQVFDRPNDERPVNHRLGRYLRRLYLPALLRGERQPLVQFFFQPHFVYYLVSDVAVLGFGRAKHDLIHQLHLAHHIHGHELAVRPYQSNLRVLSVTGYRDITNRSLEHLARAAPYLRRVDFSDTRVTKAGVEAFKAVRPNCEVVFSERNSN